MPRYYCGRCGDSDQERRLGEVVTRKVFLRLFGKSNAPLKFVEAPRPRKDVNFGEKNQILQACDPFSRMAKNAKKALVFGIIFSIYDSNDSKRFASFFREFQKKVRAAKEFT